DLAPAVGLDPDGLLVHDEHAGSPVANGRDRPAAAAAQRDRHPHRLDEPGPHHGAGPGRSADGGDRGVAGPADQPGGELLDRAPADPDPLPPSAAAEAASDPG